MATRIIVYGGSGCPACTLTRKKLAAGGVPFEYVSVDDKPDVLEALGELEWTTGLPVVVTDDVDEFRWCSLDPKAIREAVHRYGTAAAPANNP